MFTRTPNWTRPSWLVHALRPSDPDVSGTPSMLRTLRQVKALAELFPSLQVPNSKTARIAQLLRTI